MTGSPARWRSTIRVRLTLLYGAAFFVAGAVLIVFTHLFLQQSLDHQLAERLGNVEEIAADVLDESSPHNALEASRMHDALRTQFQQDRDDTLHIMFIWSVIALGVVGLVAAGLGWVLAGRALHPLQRITTTARRVADRNLHERIGLRGPDDEIKDLADTFDAMLERLDRSFDGQRRFVANASHELRTPLTINRTLIQVALEDPGVPAATRELGTQLLEVNRRHERLIDGLLVLAGSEQPFTERVPVDLDDLVRHTVTMFAGPARESGVELRTRLAAARVLGDPVLLERVVHNLLDNAIRYNLAEHGEVTISTSTTSGVVELTVANTGPVVPEDEVAALFEPFRRLAATDRLADLDQRDRGAGLGLSIVRSVVHAHDGEVHASPRPGGGLTVYIRLPAVVLAPR